MSRDCRGHLALVSRDGTSSDRDKVGIFSVTMPQRPFDRYHRARTGNATNGAAQTQQLGDVFAGITAPIPAAAGVLVTQSAITP